MVSLTSHLQWAILNVVAFYRELLPFLGLKPVADNHDSFYCVGRRTGIAIRRRQVSSDDSAFDQNRIGLHHLCFRARTREDVDDLHAFLQSLGTKIVRVPREDNDSSRATTPCSSKTPMASALR